MRSSFFVSFALIASLVVVGTNAQASKYALIIEDDFKAGKEGTYKSTNIDTKKPVVIFKLGQEDPLPLYKIVHLPDTDFNGLSTYVTYEFGTYGKALFLVHSLDTFMTVNILKNDEQIHIDVKKPVDIEASSSTKDVQNSYEFLLSQKTYVCRPSAKVEIENLKPLIECFVKKGSGAVVASLNEVRPKPDAVVAAPDAVAALNAVVAARDAVVDALDVVDAPDALDALDAARDALAAALAAAVAALDAVTARDPVVAELDALIAPDAVAALEAVIATLKAVVAEPNAVVVAPDAVLAELDAVVATLDAVLAPDEVVESTEYRIKIEQPIKLSEDDKNTLVQLLPLFKLRQMSESRPEENPAPRVHKHIYKAQRYQVPQTRRQAPRVHKHIYKARRCRVPQTWRQARINAKRIGRELPEIWDEICLMKTISPNPTLALNAPMNSDSVMSAKNV